jgi:hypothetical protein
MPINAIDKLINVLTPAIARTADRQFRGEIEKGSGDSFAEESVNCPTQGQISLVRCSVFGCF